MRPPPPGGGWFWMMNSVVDELASDRTAFAVCAVIARHSDKYGVSLVSEKKIMATLGLKKTAVIDAIKRLDAGKFFNITKRGRSNVYTFPNYEKVRPGGPIVNIEDDRSAQTDAKGPRKRTPKVRPDGPPLDVLSQDVISQEKESASESDEEAFKLDAKPPPPKPDHDEAFERFWTAYPRRVARAKAKTAFVKASKTTDPETIIQAAEAFAKSPAGKAGKFCPYPATWLNGERFNDDQKEWNLCNDKDATKYRPSDVDRRPAETIEV